VNDFELRALHERLVAQRAPGRALCPAPDALRRLAAGDAAESERLTWLEHVAACPECRAELALAEAVADAGRELVGPRRVMGPWLALAASLVLVIGGVTLWQRGVFGPFDVTRGGTVGVVLVAPRGELPAAGPIVLMWRAVPDAVSYDAEVLDAQGAPAFTARVTDTTAVMPDTLIPARGVELHWRVTAERRDGSRVRSGAQAFRIRGL
jgi:hypothetical protein